MSAFELSAIRGPLVGRVFAIGEVVVWFGRTPEATIPVASHLASRRHAEIKIENGTPVLRDLNSANGTRLNGERVQTRALSIGDVIEIGDEAFKVSGTDTPTLPQRGALVALRGPLSGRAFPLEDRPLTLGRALDSSIVLHSQRASRRHAEVRTEPRGACLYDLGSGNGTYVNGTRATWRFLSPGDVIEIGEEAFRFDPPVILPASAATQAPFVAPANVRVASPLAQSIPGEEGWGTSQPPQTSPAAPRPAPMVKGTVPIAVVQPQAVPPVAQTYPSPVNYAPPPAQQPYSPAPPQAYPAPAHPAQGYPQAPPYQPPPAYSPHAQPYPQAAQHQAPPVATGAPTFGVMCPSCRRVVDARYQECPWDGTPLANGRPPVA